jgi:hypothetical protein
MEPFATFAEVRRWAKNTANGDFGFVLTGGDVGIYWIQDGGIGRIAKTQL